MSSKTKTTATKEEATLAQVPKLRFPEFRGAEGWKETPLQNIAQPVADRAVTGDGDNILSLSGEHGLVLQSDYFGKKIAGDSAERYLKLVRNDFVYNDRTTKASAFGTIKRLSKYEGGIVSPIYKCFRFHGDEKPVYWEWYFESGNHDAALRGLVNEGARAGRFNISITQFLSTAAPRPDEAEQQKIAECLSSVDLAVAAQARKVHALKTHKKGLMQQLFPREGETQPRLRFPEFRNAGKWVTEPFAALYDFKPTNTFSRDQLSYESGTVRNIHYGDIHTKFSTSFCLQYEVVPFVNPSVSLSKQKPDAYCQEGDMVFADASEDLTDVGKSIELVNLNGQKVLSGSHTILARQKGEEFYVGFAGYLFKGRGVRAQIEKESQGTKVLQISPGRMAGIKVAFPRNKAEQQRIATSLSSLDALITLETQKLEALKTHKKGLMQQLFPSAEPLS